jgi:hypothetical protein
MNLARKTTLEDSLPRYQSRGRIVLLIFKIVLLVFKKGYLYFLYTTHRGTPSGCLLQRSKGSKRSLYLFISAYLILIRFV